MNRIVIVACNLFRLGRSTLGGASGRWRLALLFTFVLACALPNAYAQRNVDITPFFGYRFGGKIDVTRLGNPDADYLKIKSSENFGVLANFPIWRNLQGEFIWNRQPTSLTTHNPNDGTYTFLSKMNMDSYLFGASYNFREADKKVQPFVGIDFGFTHFGTPLVNGQPPLNFVNRYAFNASGGVKYFFTRNFGIRTEVRWSGLVPIFETSS
jgi:outer membrane protein W